jgi:hypothetical protein
MSRLNILSLAATIVPGILQVHRSTWIAIGIGILCLIGLTIWAAVALMGGLWGQAKSMAGAAPETARVVIEQAERVIPGANQALDVLRAATKPAPPPKDVSGTDPAPVARYPGLVRTHWQREGQQITVRYEGKADYAAVRDEYVAGFAKQAYSQNLLAASPDAERHEYIKGSDRIQFAISRSTKDSVNVTIVTTLPKVDQ